MSIPSIPKVWIRADIINFSLFEGTFAEVGSNVPFLAHLIPGLIATASQRRDRPAPETSEYEFMPWMLKTEIYIHNLAFTNLEFGKTEGSMQPISGHP
jgi:hypothetical protein